MNLTRFFTSKLPLILVAPLVLTSCSNLELANIPKYDSAYQYITLTSSDIKMYRALKDALTKQHLEVITPQSSKQQLEHVVQVVSSFYQRSYGYIPDAKVNLQQDTNLKQKSSTQKNDKHIELTNKSYQDSNNIYTSSNPSKVILNQDIISETHLNYKNILDCKGANLTYDCVANFIPNVTVISYSLASKDISRYSNDDAAQRLKIFETSTRFTIPYLGSISLNDLTSDITLSANTNPLSDLRQHEQIEDIFMVESASKIANKIVYILEDQTKRNLMRQYNKAYKEKQALDDARQELNSVINYGKAIENYLKSK